MNEDAALFPKKKVLRRSVVISLVSTNPNLAHEKKNKKNKRRCFVEKKKKKKRKNVIYTCVCMSTIIKNGERERERERATECRQKFLSPFFVGARRSAASRDASHGADFFKPHDRSRADVLFALACASAIRASDRVGVLFVGVSTDGHLQLHRREVWLV